MQRRRPPRRLRPEERDLWHEIARSARPLSGRDAFSPEAEDLIAPGPPIAPVKPSKKPPAMPLSPFRVGAQAPTLPARPSQPPAPPLRMDAKSFGKLTRGKLTPEARIDLHGMTLAEAQPELSRFITRVHASGARLVLVITGKGRAGDDGGPIPRRIGALRHEVPLWLSRAPLGPLVLQVAPAHHRHGGSGAYYVYLRRPR